MSVTAPCGSWASPIDADLITSGLVGLDALSCVGDTLFWLESRPHEQGRVVLVARRDGERRDLGVYGSVTGWLCDVRDERQVNALARNTVNKYGRIDIWINNAGYSSAAAIGIGPSPTAGH